jgi:hypothetical protein
MATTNENLKEDQDAYSAAFNEEAQPAHQMSEDEAFGITPEHVPAADDESAPAANAAEDGAEGENAGGTADIAIVLDGGELKEAAENEMAKETAVQEAQAQQNPPAPEEQAEGEQPVVDIDKETQRLKSWEGRLKAMEAKLKAAGADTPEEEKEAVGDAIEEAAKQADTPAEEEAVEQIAEQVESGQMSPEQAMKQLAEDFGDDFVKMIEAIAVAKAKEAGGQAAAELGKTVEEIINDITDTKTKTHFEQIAAVHPDFQEIGQSEQFKQFVEGMPEDEKAAAIQTIGNGSAKQINALLTQFKQAAPVGSDPEEAAEELEPAQGESIVDEAAEDAMDAAEGVRSSGMKLPEAPASNQDYESAWNEA